MMLMHEVCPAGAIRVGFFVEAAASERNAMKIEYRVRPVTRFIVTRWHESDDAKQGGVDTKGEFESEDTAHAVAYALAKQEHEQLGYPLGDERIKYPEPILPTQVQRIEPVQRVQN